MADMKEMILSMLKLYFYQMEQRIQKGIPRNVALDPADDGKVECDDPNNDTDPEIARKELKTCMARTIKTAYGINPKIGMIYENILAEQIQVTTRSALYAYFDISPIKIFDDDDNENENANDDIPPNPLHYPSQYFPIYLSEPFGDFDLAQNGDDDI